MEKSDLVYPQYDGMSLFNLSQNIMVSMGLPTRKPVIKQIPEDGKKLSVVLIDGFGYKAGIKAGILTPEDPYITSVFPSITTTALVTLMSGQMPGEHCILGGTTYVKKLGVIIDNFSYTPVYSKGKDSIKDIIPMKELYQVENIVERAEKDGKKCAIISPDFIKNSELTTITNSPYGTHFHYYNIWDAIYYYRKALEGDYDFVYMYIPFADKLSHIYGPYSEVNLDALRQIVNLVKNVAADHKEKFRVVITADHGHVEAGEPVDMGSNSDLKAAFEIPPFGSTRSVFLSGNSGLLDILNRDFPRLLIFDSSRQNFKKLLGSYDGHKIASFDYIGVPSDASSYFYPGTNDEGNTKYFKGRHGGLCPDEMMIPLIIIN